MDLYEVLGVAKTATTAEIRQAYMRLAREKHPDRFPDPADKQKAQDFFKQATEAFNTLSNERSRQDYDKELAKPKLTKPVEIAADAYQRAAQKAQERDFQEAMELLRTAVHHVPQEPRYHAALAMILAKNPHWQREAMTHLEEAIRLNGNDPGTHFEMARLLAAQGLRLRAKRSIELALRLAPEHPEVQRLAIELGAEVPRKS